MILTVCPNPAVDKLMQLGSLVPNEINKSVSEQSFPGGKGTHVALALNEMGTKCEIAGFWAGPTGDWVQQQCRSYGITPHGPEVEGWTRTCLTISTDDPDAKETEILERGPEVTDQQVTRFLTDIDQRLHFAEAVSISGSWPAGVPEDIYTRISALADKHNTPLWVDTSGSWLSRALKAAPYGIHINRAEAEELFSAGKSIDEYVVQLRRFCTFAAVTDGANGLFLGYGDQIIHAKCRTDQIISTTGAGDCLLGGLLHSCTNPPEPETMARIAAACGTANCIHPELGMLTKEDVNKLEDTVELQTIAIRHELRSGI